MNDDTKAGTKGMLRPRSRNDKATLRGDVTKSHSKRKPKQNAPAVNVKPDSKAGKTRKRSEVLPPEIAAIIAASADEEGGYLALEEAIANVATDAKGSQGAVPASERITRRQLGKLAKGISIPLTWGQLASLDAYLRRKRRSGVAALLATPSIITAIGEPGSVGFIIGSQPDESAPRIDFSRWDIRSMREILNALNARGQGSYISLDDVIFRKNCAQFFSQSPIPANEKWHADWLQDRGPSAIILGSPKANHAAEIALAKLLNVTPFRPWPSTERKRPFCFVWPDDDERAQCIHSAFSCSAQELPGIADNVDANLVKELQTRDSRTLVFVSEGHAYPIYRNGTEWDTYGVIVAQRRAGKQVWVVVAGISGPGTLGAAIEMQTLPMDLTFDEGRRCSKTVVAVVKVHVTMDQETSEFRKDLRRVVGHELIGPVRDFEC